MTTGSSADEHTGESVTGWALFLVVLPMSAEAVGGETTFSRNGWISSSD